MDGMRNLAHTIIFTELMKSAGIFPDGGDGVTPQQPTSTSGGKGGAPAKTLAQMAAGSKTSKRKFEDRKK